MVELQETLAKHSAKIIAKAVVRAVNKLPIPTADAEQDAKEFIRLFSEWIRDLVAGVAASPAAAKERWDCHSHRAELKVSGQATVYHPEHGQLCFGERHWDCFLQFPLRFNDMAAAQRWIESGYISELQESLGNLQVGFSNACCVVRGEP